MTHDNPEQELARLREERDALRAAIAAQQAQLTAHRHRLVLLAKSNRALRNRIAAMKAQEQELAARVALLEQQLNHK